MAYRRSSSPEGRRAVIANYLPLLAAERFARQRLRGLARIGGKDVIGVPIVLFLCGYNAERSQMAAWLVGVVLPVVGELLQPAALAWFGVGERGAHDAGPRARYPEYGRFWQGVAGDPAQPAPTSLPGRPSARQVGPSQALRAAGSARHRQRQAPCPLRSPLS